MKHKLKITLILVGMFLVAQLIGLGVSSIYAPTTVPIVNETTGETTYQQVYDLPYGLAPPGEVSPGTSVIMIMVSILIAVFLIFVLMKIRAEVFLRLWFFLVVIIGLGISINAFLSPLAYSAFLAILFAIPLAYLKIFKRDLIIHNFTELLIYPGIAAVFIPILNLWSAVLLLILISVYDMYAVWKAGFMQKMAKYHIEKVKIFPGFFIPYLDKKTKALLEKAKKSKKKNKNIKVSLAVLGGGDVVFPIILAGTVLHLLGFVPALIISLSATLALALLLTYSKKDRPYPAMPYITAGCLFGLLIIYLMTLF